MISSRLFTQSLVFTTRIGVRSPISSIFSTRNLLLKPDFSKLKKIEQPPGHIVGNVNDAYKIPLVSPYEGNYHWTYERILAIGLVPLTAFPFALGYEFPMVDTAFCLTVLFHAHSGFKSCIIDYIPLRVYGFWHHAASKLLSLGTFVSMYGIYVLETTENGLFDLIARLWGA
ncbi:CIC11C00000001206 [Sungouiella intermedia]|uniref:Succinate dehydrogenase [ubiquinone] cytochrome b small subunit n=1 Tax=Sungouiella intermedia TaxID=45354 RepID=A0A1L0C1B1_9ASCO|nr:CIC11C00000001206 [[Candida] intermedia]